MEKEIMNSMVYISAEVFGLYCGYSLFKTFLEEKNIGKRKVFVYIAMFLLYVGPNLIWNYPYINLVCTMLAFSGFLLIFKGTMKYKLVLLLFFLVLSLISERVIAMIKIRIFMTDMTDKTLSDIGAMAISRLFLYIMIKIMNIFYRKNRKHSLYTYQWWAALCIPALSIYIIYQMYLWSNQYQLTGKDIMPFVLIIMIVLIINGLVFYLYEKLLAEYEAKMELENIKIQNVYYADYTQHMAENQNLLRDWKHDMKNLLLGILAALKDHETLQAEAMIRKRIQNIQEIEQIIYSGNIAIDSILNYKIQEAKEKDIEVICNITIPAQLSVEYGDLAIIIGNSMDNSIEACGQLEDSGKKLIEIFMEFDSDLLQYRIKNQFKTVKRKAGIFQSTKTDGGQHGIGLRSIKAAAEKYQGKVMINAEASVFELTVYLYF